VILHYSTSTSTSGSCNNNSHSVSRLLSQTKLFATLHTVVPEKMEVRMGTADSPRCPVVKTSGDAATKLQKLYRSYRRSCTAATRPGESSQTLPSSSRSSDKYFVRSCTHTFYIKQEESWYNKERKTPLTHDTQHKRSGQYKEHAPTRQTT
jgi:hypothetical protein